MCECNQGSLGQSPDGDLTFCDCAEGIKAAQEAACRLICSYADQLAVFDRRVPIPPRMQRICTLIWLAHDGECAVRDQLKAKLEAIR